MPLNPEEKKHLEAVAKAIRILSMDAVQQADSGHPGLPMGCAEIGAYLYGKTLKCNPSNPKWMGRDRFILSAGHGSMLLYSCLYLAGYDLSLDDIKNFRQLHSKTPGHPESEETPGVETTTGPLGQGIGNAVGQAIGLKMLGAHFDEDGFPLFDSKVWTLVGDGCMMEGCASEVSSLAGHLKVDNLVVIYDSNDICLDGPTSECFTENVGERYRAYGWSVVQVDGNDLEALDPVFTQARNHRGSPLLIIAKTKIGKGSPNKSGSSKAHGSPLGKEEIVLTKQAIGADPEPFSFPQEALEFFNSKKEGDKEAEKAWNRLFEAWEKKFPEKATRYRAMKNGDLPEDLEGLLRNLAVKEPTSGRKASQDVLQYLATLLPQLIGGSADLSVSDLTFLKEYGILKANDFKARNIKFGVREFGMATIATGLFQTGTWQPFIGTFLTFSDYMRNAIRLACLMKVRVIYQFTHDSIFLGEDGPTHQPVEHLMSLRTIPGLHLIRPGSVHEVKMAWIAALKYHGPTALILSRQNMESLPETVVPYNEGMGRGGYILQKEKGNLDFILIATGSELALAIEVAKRLEALGKGARVVSMPCTELFDQQDAHYRKSVLGAVGKRVSLEAGTSFGWERYIGEEGLSISVDRFGASAPYKDLLNYFGFTPEAVLKKLIPE